MRFLFSFRVVCVSSVGGNNEKIEELAEEIRNKTQQSRDLSASDFTHDLLLVRAVSLSV